MDATIFYEQTKYRLGVLKRSTNDIGSYMAATIWAAMGNASLDLVETWVLMEAMTWCRMEEYGKNSKMRFEIAC